MQAPNKVRALCVTGNLCTNDALEHLRACANAVHITRGDMDEVRWPYALRQIADRCDALPGRIST